MSTASEKQKLADLEANNRKLKTQLASSKDCIAVGEACSALTAYVESISDPLLVKSLEPNAWTEKKGGCIIL
eukprot:CAMPEP_0117007066 /NCGR_PEP_ID=MMETSP0472-20121206/7072_1 /TAXON_ID=693140 ORGANISM="Tiarina fusus, Strain LIS" /NCGR_SAMPLE_ID=MMETSP0472 /ASSEMBLY_ACC=CAM_ASM_000603 /LENGTH=71 /DNA_ID=CAMNT_0004708715 /DNA_START=30 /DNA_END=245 /DNA_ORIENTATION=-